MTTKTKNHEIFESLKIDCERCVGFCCVALYFSESDGFPVNKKAGTPCPNLKSDFKCLVHQDLRQKGLKGCTAYDCFGAGQKVAGETFAGRNWQQAPDDAQTMFDVFVVMRQLHEMLWYLSQAFERDLPNVLKEQLQTLIYETECMTHLDATALLQLDMMLHRKSVNAALMQVSEIVRSKVQEGAIQKKTSSSKKTFVRRPDFIGKDLSKTNLRGADLSGSILIAANLSQSDLSGAVLIGADLRDTNLKGANLENCLFVTQGQINTAKGNGSTKLPKHIVKPFYWLD